MSKYYFATKGEAQSKADAIHAYIVANNSAYAKSVTDGKTVRWDVPHQDLDDKGQPVDTQWFVFLKPKGLGALTAQEIAGLL